MVFDMTTGAVIVSHEPDTVVPIASVTKLFAAAQLLAHYNLEATTTVVTEKRGLFGKTTTTTTKKPFHKKKTTRKKRGL
jgi:D-alanyl-D-alanine carboxypeptidase